MVSVYQETVEFVGLTCVVIGTKKMTERKRFWSRVNERIKRMLRVSLPVEPNDEQFCFTRRSILVFARGVSGGSISNVLEGKLQESAFTLFYSDMNCFEGNRE